MMDDLERMCQEGVVIYHAMLFLHLPAELGEIMKV
jgi:hypothetical protein